MKILIKQIITFILLPILRTLDLVMPKSKSKILLYSKGGLFHNNPKYLFLYLLKNKKNLHPIWLTSKMDVCKFIETTYGTNKCLLIKGIKGKFLLLYHYMTSYVMIIRGGTDLWEIRKLFSIKNRIVIDLCHGVPIKKTGILFHNNKKSMKNEIKRRRHVTYHPVSSDIEKYFLSSSYFVNIYKFPITGDPRNDIIFQNLNKTDKLKQLLIQKLNIKCDFTTIVLYAPTHRDGANKNIGPVFFPFNDFNEKEFRKFLEDEKICLLLRAHDEDDIFGGNRFVVNNTLLEDNRISFISHITIMDINEYFPIIDILITDYSGIYLDFLLLNKPIIFLPYDLPNYEKEGRGILFKYNLITPGPKVLTQKELIQSIAQYVKNPSKDSDKRLFMRDLFHNFQDDKSCERVTKLFDKEIPEKGNF